jgi:hypothetical protein
MEFANLISTMRQEKEDRARERSQRDKAVKAKIADLLRSLRQGIAAHGIDRARADEARDHPGVIVEYRGQSVEILVVEPDKFTIKRFMGAEDCKTVTNADEDATLRAIGHWLCPDLKD